jgi:hypothetical protein
MASATLRAVAAGAFAASLVLQGAKGQAAAIIYAQEQGSDVVFFGSGSLDLTELGFLQAMPFWYNYFSTNPGDSEFQVGLVPGNTANLYACLTTDCIRGPASFGETSFVNKFPDFGFGDTFGFWDFEGFRGLVVPDQYVSGSELVGISVYLNRTFADMGIRRGIYPYRWGSGDTAGSIVFTTETPAPLPLLGAASALAWSRRLRRRSRSALAARKAECLPIRKR